MRMTLRPPVSAATPMRKVVPALLLLLGAVLVAYRETALAMVTIWSRSDTFAHAFLVPVIVLWLVWRQRDALASMPPHPCAWMLLPMGGLAFVWLLGDLAAVNSLTQLAMVALLALAVPALLGLRAARIILFPLGFLFFAVPIGEFLLPQLMVWTADFTVFALHVSGIPVYREGNQLVIPSGNWSVVEACSGVRYLIASFMVGTLFAYLNYRSSRRRWIFVGISIALPIVANWVRAYLIVLIGHLSDNKLAVGIDHLIYGWLFFGLVMGLMFAFGAWWSEPGATTDARAAGRVANPEVGPRQTEALWATAVAAVLIVATPQLALHLIGEVAVSAAPTLTPLNPAGPWQSANRTVANWKPAFQNPSAELTSTFTSNGRDAGVYIGYYRHQDYQRKLVSSDNELVKSNDPLWASVSGLGSHTIEIGGEALTVRSALLRGAASAGTPEQRLLVWQLYWVGGSLTSSDYRAKVHAATDRLLGHGDDAAVIVLYASEEQRGDARAVLESFARANLHAIVEQLRKTREGAHAGIAANWSSNVITER
jgi:exosortase A